MTHEEAQELWRRAQTVWQPRKFSDSWTDVWSNYSQKLAHNDRYDDGESGVLLLGKPDQLGRVPIARIHPTQEIRIWMPPEPNSSP